jgi:hypothetical protein
MSRAEGPKPAASFNVPYRLGPTRHVLIRAKINGKGPYNLVLDTGAPLLILARKLESQIGVRPDRGGWAMLDRFETEGGVVVEKQTARFDDLYQLEGMNGLGLAGTEIHGLVGYPVLARFKIEYDFTKPNLRWTLLDQVPEDVPRKAMGGSGAGGLNAMGAVMKSMGQFLGINKFPQPVPRVFFGIAVVELNGKLIVESVLPGGPASACMAALDQLTAIDGVATPSLAAFARAQAAVKFGDTVQIAFVHDGQERQCVITPERGF